MRGSASLALCASFVMLVPAVSSAGWNADGVTVTSTTDNIPLVAACGDGAGGTFVAWQQESAPGAGVLRVQHLTATGDFGYPWPETGAVACTVSTARTAARMLSDDEGGAYLCWQETGGVFLTHIGSDGAISSGWPRRGRALGGFPILISDGAHGLYAAYSGANSAVALHLGPANAGVGGWTSARALVAQDPDAPYTMWPGIALAPDGGVFVACASYGFDPDLIAFTPGHLRVRRLTAGGVSYPGWDDAGIDEGAFDRSLFGAASTRSSLIAAAPDGAGGAFFLLGSPTGTDQGYPTLQTRLLDVGGDGLSAPGAPASGVVINEAPAYYVDGGLDGSYELRPASPGAVFAGFPAYYTDAPVQYMYSLCSQSGGGWGIQGDAVGHEAATTMGAVYVATFHPTGPYGPYDPPAFIAVDLYDGVNNTGLLSEYHNDILQHWYGDIGLAASNDGEAVFFWSQENEKYGLFARKFNAAGQVTAAPAAARDPGLLSDVRFERGIGVRATVRLDPGEHGRLALFDVQGRAIAGMSLLGTGAPTTQRLGQGDAMPSGLYFLRLSSVRLVRSARVVVVR